MSGVKQTRDYYHPYTPYDVQSEFMEAVYNCLEDGKVGIFESPTGTGKSLSLICGSLTWLRDHRRQLFQDGFTRSMANSDEPDWMLEHVRKQQKQEALHRKQEFNSRLAKVKAREKHMKDRYKNGESYPKRQKVTTEEIVDDGDESQFTLDDYNSDNGAYQASRPSTFNEAGLSTETQALMEQLGFSRETSTKDDDNDGTKIFFCSRTHSQLTQFSSELRRVKMPSSILPDEPIVQQHELFEEVKHLTLGSRKNLCINSKVKCLGNATAINERCLELQQSTNIDSRCPHVPTAENQALVNDFRDHALAKIRDIEDLGTLGRTMGICPYYASRPAIKHCEIVTLPYPLLIQRTAREALGLSLKNHVVIIDEAHNLMDAIAGIYSVSVTLDQVQQARVQLTMYLQKFRTKLKGKNRVYIAQIIRMLDSVITYLRSIDPEARNAEDGLVDISSIMAGKGLDQVNVFKLNAYLQESKLARKVDGYTTYAATTHGAVASTSDHSIRRAVDQKHGFQSPPRQNVPVLMHVQAFLLSLMNPSAEGRFIYSKGEDNSDIHLKYLLLDPTFHFRDIVEDARAIVLAGGTMSPMSDYEHHLLSYLDPSRIMTLSCGHVIPSSNLLAMPIVMSSSGIEFDFTFENRNKERTMQGLGDALLNCIKKIPDGVVVFFPSYSYLDKCIATWKRNVCSTTKHTCWSALEKEKPIFLEQRSQESSLARTTAAKGDIIDSVLTAYRTAIASGKGRGALLFAVIGGTLSEGINFSDALGRGVIVVGLPFPNPHSAEWKAKMQYIGVKAIEHGGDDKAAARDFYENACMRAVNQCVGRAIRHKGDYASILMLDKRYGTKRIQGKLPKWIQGSLSESMSVSGVEEKLSSFFISKKL